ncbi:hypothetical protein GIB67_010651 [Kingdonia uniflora]|uniref:LOB domain-containing protein n=1 Tax=Kingdonia uniflora TaxID=39325 RepID=A0A7J7MMY7_9MAGN|nr:hypothetical protein GIB67_010651 [Kingdonia uniflora]
MSNIAGANDASVGGGGGPCGACKFLRRKCAKGCIFAPYFDTEQGSAHFAAVHKVFGASNVSKLLHRIPVHKRLDAVVTICYEALARIKDPVYGCVSHIFALQQQVVSLQTELAIVQAQLSIFDLSSQAAAHAQSPSLPSTSSVSNSNGSAHFVPPHSQNMMDTSSYNPTEIPGDDGDLHALAREFISKYLSGVKFRP